MKNQFLQISRASRPVAAIFGLAAAFYVAFPASGADPHQHGVGQRNVAVEGNDVEIELETPGTDIVGFEHTPRTKAQKKAVQDAAKALRDGAALFVFPAAAGCTFKEAEVESGLLADAHEKHGDKHRDEKHHGKKHSHEKHHDEKHHGKKHDHEKHHGEKHDEETHAEFHAHYHFTCKNPVTHADLRYFETFPRAEALSARLLTASGQSKQKLTRKAARLKF